MVTITFSAFSFLREKLARRGMGYSNETLELAEGTTVAELVAIAGLTDNEVEAVIVNARAVPWDRQLQNGDCVALVPLGTPGPYRVLLGMSKPPRTDRSA